MASVVERFVKGQKSATSGAPEVSGPVNGFLGPGGGEFKCFGVESLTNSC